MLAKVFIGQSSRSIKLIWLLLTALLVQLSAEGYGQVTLSEKNTPIAKVLKAVEKQTTYTFIYDEAKLKLGTVTIELKNASIEKALEQCFKDAPLTYQIIGNTIILKPKKEELPTVTAIITPVQSYFISGKVIDSKGESIAGATVFLTESKKTIATNIDGTFVITQLQPGIYELVVKVIGFETFTQSINIQKQPINTIIKLSESITPINEVVIKSKIEPNRTKYLKIFTQNFIGESANSTSCKILNPEVIKLHFNKEKDVVEATSDDFIKIENRALGYTVSYLLNYFVYNMHNQYFEYEGKPYFEELPGTEKQQKIWENNRRIAYEGSSRHFFKALFNNTIDAEGFLIYRIPINPAKSEHEELAISQFIPGATENTYNARNNKLYVHQVKLSRQELSNVKPLKSDSLISIIDKDFKFLKLNPVNEPVDSPTKLFIVYVNEEEPAGFYNSDEHIEVPVKNSTRKSQVSQLAPIKDGILLDKNGSLNPVNDIIFSGYWTWERVADLMPFDYNPKKLNKTNAADTAKTDE